MAGFFFFFFRLDIPIKLRLISASAPQLVYVLPCLLDGAFKTFIAAHEVIAAGFISHYLCSH